MSILNSMQMSFCYLAEAAADKAIAKQVAEQKAAYVWSRTRDEKGNSTGGGYKPYRGGN
jgi:hypothetical protein